MKIIKWLFTVALSVLLLAFGALLLLQTRWTKEQLSQILQEIALQSGIQLSIEKIEGELPLKWSLTNVRATFLEGDTAHIDHVQIRIAVLPLLRGHFGISYLHADHTTLAISPTFSFSQTQKPPSGSFSIRSAIFDEIKLINRATQEEKLFHLKGGGRYSHGGDAFFLDADLRSPDLYLTLFCEKSKRLDHIQTSVDLSVLSRHAFEPFYKLPTEMSFDLRAHSEGPWSSLQGKGSKPIDGVIELDVREPETFKFASHFALFPDRSWDLSHLAILSPLIQLQGSAQFTGDGLPKTIYTTLSIPDFSLLYPALKGHAVGELDLHDEKCFLTLTTPELTLNSTTFTQGKLEILAQVQNEIWNAAIQMKANHPTLGYQATSELYWKPNASLEVKAFDLTSNIGRIAGDIQIRGKEDIVGGVSFQLADLFPLSEITTLDLAGQIGGQIHFEGATFSCRALGKSLKVNQFLSTHIDFDATQMSILNPTSGSLKVTSDEAYFRDIHFYTFSYDMGWNTRDWDYHLNATGDWKGSFNVATNGRLSFFPFKLYCQSFSGQALGKEISLHREASLEVGKENFQLAQWDLSIGEGRLSINSHLNKQSASLQMQASHFPLDFLSLYSPRFSLSGLSSLDIGLEAKPETVEGHFNLILEHADIVPAGSSSPIQTKGSLQAHVGGGTLQLHSHLVATDEQFSEISASLPIHFSLSPLQFSIPEHLPISGQCTIVGHTEQLFDFINLGSQRIGGFLSCKLLLSGTLQSPSMHGPLTIQNGFYENYFVGISVQNANVTGHAQGNQMIIDEALATDGAKGTSSSKASIFLTPGFPFALEGTIDHFRIIQFDWLTGICSGPFKITGDLSGCLAQGKLTLDEADITIPDQIPYDIPTLPITFIHESPAHIKQFKYVEPYPFRYDLEIHGDHDLNLSGRGLDAELEGDIHLTGQNLAVIAAGALYTKKGKFSFAGKDFIINKGEIVFFDEKSFMNITSTVDYPGLTITVHFRGDLKNPQLIFESNPSLPTSSILSRILFNKDVSELTAGQAIQLANTIVTLSGSSAPNVLDTIRKSIGVDRLSISANEDTGKVSVEIGKYITRGVLISLIQSTEHSQVRIQVELKAGFVLEGETQANNQGKLSFKWNMNY